MIVSERHIIRKKHKNTLLEPYVPDINVGKIEESEVEK